jgi:plastocyanin
VVFRRREIVVASVASLAAALALVPLASGGSTFITVEANGANKFDPEVIGTGLGDDNLAWRWDDDGTTNGMHNVRQDDKLFYSGRPTNHRDPFVRSVSAGSYRYYCERHGGPGGQGMAGKITVNPISDGPATDDTQPIRWATDQSTTGDQYDVRFRVGSGHWHIWKRNTAKRRGVFGKDDSPVDFDPTKLYYVQARSEKSANPKRRSGWSGAFLFGDTPF